MQGTVMLVIFTIVFVGIAVWAYLPRNKAKMKAYGEIPLHEDDNHGRG